MPALYCWGRLRLPIRSVLGLGYPGTGLTLRLQGDSLRLLLSSTADTSALTVVTDHGAPTLKTLHKGEQSLVLAQTKDTTNIEEDK